MQVLIKFCYTKFEYLSRFEFNSNLLEKKLEYLNIKFLNEYNH